MLLQTFPVKVWMEGPRFLARCLATGTVSEGASQAEALERLRQGVALYQKGGSAPMLQVVGPLTHGP